MAYISKTLIPERPLLVLPSLAKAIGLNEALVLQQLHYWLQASTHVMNGRRWTYNTYADWDNPSAAIQFRQKAEKVISRLLEHTESGRHLPEFPGLS